MSNSEHQYILHLADNALVLGQRLGEWCGHAPVLEQDIALTNIALDLIGQARMLYQYVAEQSGQGATEDTLAFLRTEREYYNVLLVEQPNGHFGTTMMRQFLFDVFNFYNLQSLANSGNVTLAAIAAKSIKEVKYHLDFSSSWIIRLGDGTEESHQKMAEAAALLWKFTGELYTPTPAEIQLSESGIAPDWKNLEELWTGHVGRVMAEATLAIPETPWMHLGGKDGKHTEHMGFLLTELQYLQRAYPEAQW